MIQDIRIKNFLSFRNEVVFSFEATKDSTLEDSLTLEVAPGIRLLRFAMVMGANGSGKSNLLYCFSFLQSFWNNIPDVVDETTGACPFMFDSVTKDQPSEFGMHFWIDGLKYHYYLKLDADKTYEEKLSCYKSVQPTLIFSRTLVDNRTVISFNPTLKVSKAVVEALQVHCLNNMSVFAARSKINTSIPYLDEVREWAKTSIADMITPDDKLFLYCKEKIHRDPEVKKYILDFLNSVNFNITNIVTDEMRDMDDKLKKALGNLFTTVEVYDDIADSLVSNDCFSNIMMHFTHRVTNDRGVEKYVLPASLESYGTRRSMGLETALFMAERANALMPIDEFDNSVHPNLMEYCIKRFLKSASSSQLLITTHYDPLLSAIDRYIRKDCVWFTEKDPNGSTNLFPLIEFKGLNRLSSIQNSYNDGKFGALPVY